MKTVLSLLVLISGFVTSTSHAQNIVNVICKKDDLSVELKIKDNAIIFAKVTGYIEYENANPEAVETLSDKTVQYSFLVDNSYDTNTWFNIYIQNNQIVKKEIYESGNDSDNHSGYKVAEGDDAFICK